jgi:hypothetical protein
LGCGIRLERIELKSKIIELKNLLKGFNNTLDRAKEKISKLEDMLLNITKLEDLKEKMDDKE